jgi:acetyl-CoA synthetase
MRRLLRKLASGEFSNLGDTSTLADPDALTVLTKKVQAVLAKKPAA